MSENEQPLDVKQSDRAEHERIETALEVERLDVNLFRSKSLWVPNRARGAFGGQVISQAIVSATNCVAPGYSLHSLHCYFLLSVSPAVPVLYFVEPLRKGKSYAAHSVKAVQEGRVVFILMCSFQRPEPWQPSTQWKMPTVPSPDECEEDEVRYVRLANADGVDACKKQTFLDFATERARSPIRVKTILKKFVSDAGVRTYMYWMQARSIPKYDAPFQKCILSYLSDLRLLGAGARTLGLKANSQGPDGVGMTSSLDHAIYFYDDNFDCGNWLLYVMDSSRAGSGRGVIHGRLFTQGGTLVAVTTQEGVIRANVRGPTKSKL